MTDNSQDKNRTRPIPKSLHTITVFVRLARLMKTIHPHATDEGALGLAIIELGYVDTPDTHGLKAKALKVMQS